MSAHRSLSLAEQAVIEDSLIDACDVVEAFAPKSWSAAVARWRALAAARRFGALAPVRVRVRRARKVRTR